MYLEQADLAQCQAWESELLKEYQNLKGQGLNLDLTRGKPCSEQLSLSDKLDGILAGKYISADGTDCRNYGGLDGLPEAKTLGALLLGTEASKVLVGGNSSLTLMFYAVLIGHQFGYGDSSTAWSKQGTVKFLCPVPGYDRHFSICEKLGIEMISVAMTDSGPDMDAVERLVKQDPSIKGLWCVPKYSNPTGVIYSDETVDRIAKLGLIAGDGFKVFWDNAYSVHDLESSSATTLANIESFCQRYGTEDSVIQFASTSKITHAGSGLSFLASSANNLAAIKSVLAIITIGPDKENQLRHCLLLPDREAISQLMIAHAAIIKPRFDTVLSQLHEAFAESDLGQWQKPKGGYFIAFDTAPNCAKDVVKLSAEAGVKLTPAGATFPYGKDPEDRNIRIAPTVPSVAELEKAMAVFICCVKLASVQRKISTL
ncbi:aminotransferase class I/II-fold pyridoxal phosphate-dependent enzyme [Aurantivibrio infirmus]